MWRNWAHLLMVPRTARGVVQQHRGGFLGGGAEDDAARGGGATAEEDRAFASGFSMRTASHVGVGVGVGAQKPGRVVRRNKRARKGCAKLLVASWFEHDALPSKLTQKNTTVELHGHLRKAKNYYEENYAKSPRRTKAGRPCTEARRSRLSVSAPTPGSLNNHERRLPRPSRNARLK